MKSRISTKDLRMEVLTRNRPEYYCSLYNGLRVKRTAADFPINFCKRSQERTAPHESPHFCATLKSPSLGFPRAAGWRIIREGELCARRRNDLISFMTS